MTRIQILIFLILNLTSSAQNLEEGEKIAPDRPGFGDAVSVVPKRAMHIETGTWLEREKLDSLIISGFGINSTLFRFGLFQKTELRVDYNLWNTRTSIERKSVTGFYPFRIGMKQHLVYNKGLRPAITFIGMQELPFSASKNFRPIHPATDLQLSFANSVTEKFAICYNAGAVLSPGSKQYLCYYAFATEFALNEKTGYYFQAHSSSQFFKDAANHSSLSHHLHFLEGGFMYYPNHNIQLDISGGFKAAESAMKKKINLQEHRWFFVTIGFSWRFALRT